MSDTFALLPLLRRWWWALLLGALLAGGAALFVTSHMSPEYKGEAKFIVGPINANADDLGASGSLARTYSELAADRPVLRYAIDRAGSDLTVKELQKSLTATANDITRILTITVLDDSARKAANLANAIGARLRKLSRADADQNASRITQFADSAPVAGLTPRQREQVVTAARALLGETSAGRITVVQSAVPEGPADRGTLLMVIIAMLAGAMVAAIVVLFRESSGQGIDDEALLEELSGVTQLGRVDAPRGRNWRRSLPAWTAPGTTEAEKYGLLAFKLGYLESNESPGSLVLLDPKEGHTSGIVAGNLAAAISQAGWRVLIVDANTTGQGLTSMFRLEGSRGYTDLLASSDPGEVDGAIHRLMLGTDDPLCLLPRGGTRSPVDIDVDGVRWLLERLEEIADVVLVSAPPPHRVPAGLMWARVAKRTLLVLDEGRTSRAEAKNTLQSLAVADANVIGAALAQRRPLAELVGRLRGASSTPPHRVDAEDEPRAPVGPRDHRPS